MDEKKTRSLLWNKSVQSADIGRNANILTDGGKDMESPAVFDLRSLENASCYNEQYSDLLQNIGIGTEFIGDSLSSYSRQLQESPYSARSLVSEIIEKNVTGTELAYIELFDILQRNDMDAEALRFIIYAYVKLNETSEVGEPFYRSAISFGSFSKNLHAVQFADYLIDKIAKDKKAAQYMSIKMYSIICKYYHNRLEVTPWKDREGVFFAKGMMWSEKTIYYYKTNENGYFWRASFLLRANRRREAERVLKSSIYDPPDPARDTYARQQCPRCCKLYLEEFRESISFGKLEEMIARGLKDCIVFKPEESSEYNEHMTFFQDQRQKLDEIQRKII